MILLAVALGTGLQACCGTLFHIETSTLTSTPRRPEKPVSEDDFTITEFEFTAYRISISPNWPVAVPLALLACAGLVTLAGSRP
jgi:hypothetical protein